MSNKPAEDVSIPAESLPRKDSSEIKTYYTNSMSILSSVYDFVLTVGQMQGTNAEDLHIEQQARIIMSPQHLKVLSRLLAEKMEGYEQAFGKIPEVPSFDSDVARQE